MKNKILTVCILIATFGYLAPIHAQDKILLCGKNIYDESNPFFWTNIEKKIVPDKLGPGYATVVYKVIYMRYLKRLDPEDNDKPFVHAFSKLLENIVSGLKSANLSMKPGIENDELNSGGEKVTDVPCQDIDKKYLIDAYYVSIAYKKVHDRSWEKLREEATRAIEQRTQQYGDWFNNGLPMWPLESWINGKLLDESDAEQPPGWQLVFIRPSVGVGLNSDDGLKDIKPELTLAIEPIGFVKYKTEDYSKYWGVSLLLTTGEDHGIGYGLLGRYRTYTLGIVKREDNMAFGVSDDDVYVFIGLGFDLYHLVHKKNTP